jgi:hypothetical protein
MEMEAPLEITASGGAPSFPPTWSFPPVVARTRGQSLPQRVRKRKPRLRLLTRAGFFVTQEGSGRVPDVRFEGPGWIVPPALVSAEAG